MNERRRLRQDQWPISEFQDIEDWFRTQKRKGRFLEERRRVLTGLSGCSNCNWAPTANDFLAASAQFNLHKRLTHGSSSDAKLINKL